jgi:hypothetical protein
METLFDSEVCRNMLQIVSRSGEAFKLLISDKHCKYLWILKNNSPVINNTLMNIHQVVENCRLLEEKMVLKTNTIGKLESLLREQTKQIERLNDIVANQTKQIEVIQQAINTNTVK